MLLLAVLRQSLQKFRTLGLKRHIHGEVPQKGLALMGFSRYCPSSLDLPNFVVRSCRGGCASYLWPRPGPSQISGKLGPGNPESGNPKKAKHKKNIKISSAPNIGKVWISRKTSSWPHLVPLQAIFSMDRKNKKHT